MHGVVPSTRPADSFYLLAQGLLFVVYFCVTIHFLGLLLYPTVHSSLPFFALSAV